MFVAADQLLKGAALNAIQVAEHLLPSSRSAKQQAGVAVGVESVA
jgi:hypothetical protein